MTTLTKAELEEIEVHLDSEGCLSEFHSDRLLAHIRAQDEKLRRVEGLCKSAEASYFCNKCGYLGKRGPTHQSEHNPCGYYAIRYSSVRVSDLDAILNGEKQT